MNVFKTLSMSFTFWSDGSVRRQMEDHFATHQMVSPHWAVDFAFPPVSTKQKVVVPKATGSFEKQA